MIKVCDAIMGTGKSSAAINYMNDHCNEKFIYITPFLDEAERIKKGCPKLHFVEPSDKLKKYHFKKTEHTAALIRHGRNITTTHQAFKRYGQEMLDIIKEQNYHLIIDENVDTLEPYEIHPDDLQLAIDSGLVKCDGDRFELARDNYSGILFSELCSFLKTRDLFKFDGQEQGELFYWVLPPKLLNAFNEVIVLTYLFEGQSLHHFFKIHNMPYKYIGIQKEGANYRFSEYPCYTPEYVKDIKNKIHILDNKKMNAVGDDLYALSKNWFCADGKDEERADVLKKHLYNYMNNIGGNVDKDCKLWSCFKESYGYGKLRGKGYTNSFLIFNKKSTNIYKNCTHLAYLVNLFMNVNEKVYYYNHGIEVDERMYALSIMVQWIWRSAIRDGKDITLYIPSRRMRDILVEWLDTVSKGGNTVNEAEML